MLVKDKELESGIHIDFVPMVDVLFNLLIFFLLATTIAQVEREMQIALPFASSAGPISAALREIIVNVDNEGRIVMSGRPVEPEELRQMIAAAVKANPEQKVSVRGDKSTPYANIVRVLDICKGAGVQQPYLDTVLE
jgi:biopolymer transport protein ExbD